MKTKLIRDLRQLIAPDHRPEALTFRQKDDADLYEHNGQVLTRQECLLIPAKRHVFVVRRGRKPVDDEQA